MKSHQRSVNPTDWIHEIIITILHIQFNTFFKPAVEIFFINTNFFLKDFALTSQFL